MAIPVALYVSEPWEFLKRDRRQITSTEIKFLRAINDCTLVDRTTNAYVRQELNNFQL